MSEYLYTTSQLHGNWGYNYHWKDLVFASGFSRSINTYMLRDGVLTVDPGQHIDPRTLIYQPVVIKAQEILVVLKALSILIR